MSTMVERVARAICENSGQSWESAAEGYREICIGFARDAIEALEPTDAMILAGYNALMEWDARTGEDHGIAEIWNAMRTAALQEQEQGR